MVSDAVADLTPRASSELIAEAFQGQGAQVAVLPVGSGGSALADALATVAEPVELASPAAIDDLLASTRPGEGPLVLDLTGIAVPPLDRLVELFTPDVVAGVREALAGRELVAVVPRGQETTALAGLSGTIAELGRLRGADLAETISENNRAEAWATSLGVDPAGTGSGAVGGAGVVVQALGGRVAAGLDFCLDRYRAPDVLRRADVLVAGTAQLDFHDLGGPVVKVLSGLAAEGQRPLVVLAGRTFVSSRELRLAGIEAAYAVLPGAGSDEPSLDQWREAAGRVAVTWRW